MIRVDEIKQAPALIRDIDLDLGIGPRSMQSQVPLQLGKFQYPVAVAVGGVEQRLKVLLLG